VTLYRFRPGGLGDAVNGPPELLGRLFAEAVVRDRRHAEALATADQLDTALRSHAVVDQACGIVMHAMGVEAATALGPLRGISQRTNRKLSDLAATVVRTRGLSDG
jgi:AmiR/NasT family two-component response regulator